MCPAFGVHVVDRPVFHHSLVFLADINMSVVLTARKVNEAASAGKRCARLQRERRDVDPTVARDSCVEI